jgi:uncharacterized protein YaiL (DUF2058 family)
VDKGRAQKLKKQKHKQGKQRARGAGGDDVVKQSAREVQAAKAAKDRALSREHQAAAEQRAIAAQVRQLIETNAIDRGAGDVAYNFPDGGIVKKITTTPDQQQHLAAGRIAIARLDTTYVLIPAQIAGKIAERDPESIVVCNTAAQTDVVEDDEYADYQIPDDLTW